GDGCQVRDVLWIGDLVEAMDRAIEVAEETPGEVFNIGGGRENAVSVRTVIDYLMEITGEEVPVQMSAWRPGDQRLYISDTTRAESRLGWRPTVSWPTGMERLLEWIESARLPAGVLPFPAADRTTLPARAAS